MRRFVSFCIEFWMAPQNKFTRFIRPGNINPIVLCVYWATEVSVHEPGVIRGSWLTADVKSLLLKLIPCLREAGVLQRAISLDGPTARCLAAAAELGYAREDGLNTDEPVPSEAELAFRFDFCEFL